MGVFNNIINSLSPKPSKAKDHKGNVLYEIKERQLYRVRQDIKKWRAALNSAESQFHPRRVELMRLYQELVLDNHLHSLMATRKAKVLSQPYVLIKRDKQRDELLEPFNQEWFTQFMDYALDAVFYGHSLVQFSGRWDNRKGFDYVELVPRQHVRPELQVVSVDHYGSGGIKYDEPPYKDWVLPVGGRKDLGLLAKAAPNVLWKRHAMSAWAEYQEIFGHPVRIGYARYNDEEQRSQMEKMLSQMGTAAWGVFDEESASKIELVETGKTDAHKVYLALVEQVNQELSKLVLGQTMTSEDGSSRSQAEVHERVMESHIGQDMRLVENVVNGYLLPLLQKHGAVNLRNAIFRFDTKTDEEEADKRDFERVIKLKQAGYHPDEKEIERRFDIKLKDVEPNEISSMEAAAQKKKPLKRYTGHGQHAE